MLFTEEYSDSYSDPHILEKLLIDIYADQVYNMIFGEDCKGVKKECYGCDYTYDEEFQCVVSSPSQKYHNICLLNVTSQVKNLFDQYLAKVQETTITHILGEKVETFPLYHPDSDILTRYSDDFWRLEYFVNCEVVQQRICQTVIYKRLTRQNV